ncbi:predicted protein [Naegleria gruberi]|uniref:Predicted protein n=1 Tax=Naegleria gruberi TaxID=5762 RepID=D2V1X6_NAEGR|nr:uncharacterized protein NAEGRDRAFT_62730 [Naegleria gruberi]EFC49236.1 predicted protein [Naegleria gruberi]|eukprot:XP_002681980.1 predicted protein [Naegleria gruberi strain NEG-M]
MASKEIRGSYHVDEELEQQGKGLDDLIGKGIINRNNRNYLESRLKTNIRPLTESDDYEVYFSGKSINGSLLTGSLEAKKLDGFEKFTKYGGGDAKKILIPKGQALKFIDIGLQFTVIMTNLNEAFLYGDFVYGSSSADINPLGRQLSILMTPEVKINNFPYEPVAMLCGEQFVAVLDSCNRLWYCGIETHIGTASNNCTYDFVEIGLKKYLETEFNDETTHITHFRVGGRHLCLCINNRTIISTGANYFGQLGIINTPDLVPSVLPSTVVDALYSYTFVKSWNEDGKYRVRDVACSGNMTAILTECGKLFKTCNASEPIQAVVLDGFSLTTIGGNWTHILAHTSKNQMMGITDNHVTEFFSESPIKNCDNLQISTGTNSNYTYFIYSNNELYEPRNPNPVLKSSLPIVVCKMTSKATMVLCMNCKNNKSIVAMKRNMLQCTVSQGLSDILINVHQ